MVGIAGHIGVGIHQGAHLHQVRGGQVRLFHTKDPQSGCAFSGCLRERRSDLRLGDGAGVADVDGLDDAVGVRACFRRRLQTDDTPHQGQGPEVVVFAGDTRAGPVEGSGDTLYHGQESALRGAEPCDVRVSQQGLDQADDGAFTLVGLGSMGGLARCVDGFAGEGSRSRKLSTGLPRHRVHRATAGQFPDPRLTGEDGLAHQLRVVDALFAVPHGKLRIGGEQEVRVGLMGAVVLHIRHARLLIGAENDAHVEGQRFSASRQETAHRIQGEERHQQWTLVVHDTAAQKIAFPLGDGEGFHRPTGTGTHHVHVADDAQLLGAFTATKGVRIPYVAVHVVGIEAKALGKGQRGLKGPGRLGTEGRPGSGGGQILHTGNLHQTGEVCHHGVPVCLQIGFQVRIEFFGKVLVSNHIHSFVKV